MFIKIISKHITTSPTHRFIPSSDFEPSIVKNASKACEGLCKWVRAIDVYDRVIRIVAPKKIKLADAENELAVQMKKLNAKREKLKQVRNKEISDFDI